MWSICSPDVSALHRLVDPNPGFVVALMVAGVEVTGVGSGVGIGVGIGVESGVVDVKGIRSGVESCGISGGVNVNGVASGSGGESFSNKVSSLRHLTVGTPGWRLTKAALGGGGGAGESRRPSPTEVAVASARYRGRGKAGWRVVGGRNSCRSSFNVIGGLTPKRIVKGRGR